MKWQHLFPVVFTVQVQKVDIAQMNNNFMVLQVRGSGGTDRVRNLVEDNILSDLENIEWCGICQYIWRTAKSD